MTNNRNLKLTLFILILGITSTTIAQTVVPVPVPNPPNFEVGTSALELGAQAAGNKALIIGKWAKYIMMICAMITAMIGIAKANNKTHTGGEDATKAYTAWFLAAGLSAVAFIVLLYLFPSW